MKVVYAPPEGQKFCTLENPCDGGEMPHNCFNYHRKFTDEEQAEDKRVVGLFLKSFKVLDWFGQIWSPKGQTMKYCMICDMTTGVRETCFRHPKARLRTKRHVMTHPNIEFPTPWAKIMEGLYNELLPYKDVLVIDQIKEKWGGLRVYYSMFAQPEGSNNFRSMKEVDVIIEKYAEQVESLYPKA